MNKQVPELSFAQYPADKFNLLIPMQTVSNISEVHKPVMNMVQISTNEADGEIYMQDRAKSAYNGRPAQPARYALTKKGLNKLARAAGIQVVNVEAQLPSVCQKCVQINKNTGTPINCHRCGNKDVKYEVTISVPQLSGETLAYRASKEIVIDDVTDGMSAAQKREFMKFRSEMCETKALNRALRSAMQIKGTYTIEELQKPFIVAYLVPNLDHPEVRKEAIKNFFASSNELYGTPAVETSPVEVESEDEARIESTPLIANPEVIEHEEVIPQVKQIPEAKIYSEPEQEQQKMHFGEWSIPETQEAEEDPTLCTECHTRHCSEKEIAFSNKKYGRTICFACQQKMH